MERCSGKVGEQLSFDRVLLVGDEKTTHLGTPLVAEARVVGTISEQGKQGKIFVFKFKRRKGYRRKQGHRQLVTTVRIDEIGLAGQAERKRDTAPAEKTPQKTAKKKTEKAAGKEPPAKVAKKKTAKRAVKKQLTKKAPKKAVKKTTATVSKGKSATSKKAATKSVKKKTTKSVKGVTKKTTKK